MVPPLAREVPATATLTLDHDAYFGRVCRENFAIVSRAGVLTVLDGRLRTVRRLELGGPSTDVSVLGDRWAWLASGELWVGEPGGVAESLGAAGACRWTPAGLWSAVSTGDEVRVELRAPDVVRTVAVPDPFGDSMVRLRHHPHADKVVLWIAGGPDGQQSWVVRADGTAEHVPADDCIPALFSPACDWLLAAGDDGLTRVSWPDRVELGSLSWADIDPDAEKDGSDEPGDCLMALPGGFVSWSTGNGRLRTIDPRTMSVVDEFALAGHPVRTVADYYPDLTDDSPCGDFSYAVPHGDGTVLSVHGESSLVLSVLRDWSPK